MAGPSGVLLSCPRLFDPRAALRYVSYSIGLSTQ